MNAGINNIEQLFVNEEINISIYSKKEYEFKAYIIKYPIEDNQEKELDNFKQLSNSDLFELKLKIDQPGRYLIRVHNITKGINKFLVKVIKENEINDIKNKINYISNLLLSLKTKTKIFINKLV